MIDLCEVSIEEKSVLRNLLELAIHDYSEFNGDEIGEHGLFGYKYVDHYWTEPERFAYFVRVEGKLAGFALGRRVSSNDRVELSLSEFFILRKYRRKGIGTEVARMLFDRHPGRWSVGQETGNDPAQAFWRKVIEEYTNGNFTETFDPKGPVQQFESPG